MDTLQQSITDLRQVQNSQPECPSDKQEDIFQASRNSLALARQCFSSGDIPAALEAAGKSAIFRRNWREPYCLIAEICFAQGDGRAGEIYLQIAGNIARPDQAVLNEACYDTDEFAQYCENIRRTTGNVGNGIPVSDNVIKLAAGGDVLLGRQMPGWVELNGTNWPFQGIAARLAAADLALVNLETSVSTLGDFLDKGGRQPYYYHNHPEMLDVLVDAGIQVVCMANNHALDYGREALVQQCDILDACGFVGFGAGRNEIEAATPRYIQAGDLIIAFIGIETETICMRAASDVPGIHHADANAMLRTVAGSLALARAYADIVIVSPHWGGNWQENPTPEFQTLARSLIDLGADVVLGHSAHVLQGVELYRGCPIVYDMGTLLFDRVAQGRMRYSALFELELSAGGVRRLGIVPVKLTNGQANLAEAQDANYIRELIVDLSKGLNPGIEFCRENESLFLECHPEKRPRRSLTASLPQPLSKTSNLERVPEQYRQIKSNLIYAEMPASCAWPVPVPVNRNLDVLGARFASPIRTGRGFVCEVYFRAASPVRPGRVEARIVGLNNVGQIAFEYIHPVAEGVHPPARWNRHEIICDRVFVRPGTNLANGVYDVYWHLRDLESGVDMPVESAQERVVAGKVFVGKLTVSQDAPPGVAGISEPLRIPHIPPAAPRVSWVDSPLRYWEDHVQPWVAHALGELGISFRADSVKLVRNNPWGLVLSMDTDRGRVFFKALGPASRHEFHLLEGLAGRWPDRVPQPLAAQPELAWMLMPDCGVSFLQVSDRNERQKLWRILLQHLAEIQIDSCREVTRWLEMGLPDRRLELLPSWFAQLLDNGQAIALDQPNGLQSAERDEARELLPHFRRCCLALGEQPLSAGLCQGDLHMGNILTRDSQVVLADWGAACVTHPFSDLLLIYDSGLQDKRPLGWFDWLDQAYLQAWSTATGKSVEALRTVLHGVLWVAHIIRVLGWAKYDDKQGMVAKWIRLWLQRNALLTSKLMDDATPVIDRATRPPRFATVENPLLLDVETIARLTGGEWRDLPEDTLLTGMSHSRKYLADGTQGNLYFPINADTSDFSFTAVHVNSVVNALRMGAVAAVAPRDGAALPPGTPHLRVDGLMTALEALGVHVRDHLYTGKRVLVTGTEGKTGFKCMLHHVLAPQISTHAVLNSTNMDYSLYASFASIRRQDQIAVFEAAGTHPGRCRRRSLLVKPHLFVITEVGNEHINYHGSQQGVIDSKADIVSGALDGAYGILNADSLNYPAVRKAVLARRRLPLLLFGSSAECNGRLLGCRFENNGWSVSAEIEGGKVEYRLPLLGEHAPLASVSVLLAAYYLGADVARAAVQLADFAPYESQGVLRHIPHRGGEFLLFDNASRASVLSYQSALRTAARLTPPNPAGRKVAMIGQMIFLGDEAPGEHARLAEWIDESGFDCIIFVGEYMETTYSRLRNPSAVVKRFPSYDRRHSGKAELQQLIDALMEEARPGDLVFVKGELDEMGDYLRSLEIKPPQDKPQPTTARLAPSRNDSGALAGLVKINLNDLPRYKTAINMTRQTCWQSYFPFLFFHGQKSNSEFLIEEDCGSLCVYRLRRQRESLDLCLFLLPMPFQADVLERCLERVRTFNGVAQASIFRVDGEDIPLFQHRANTRIVACPEEYIYAPVRYRDLSGRKNRDFRRGIQAVERLSDVEVLSYDVTYQQNCVALLDRWAAIQQTKYQNILFQGYTRNCLEQYPLFPRNDLFGKVIRIGGEVVSFGFAGEIRAGMGDLFITYSDHGVDGLNKYLIYSLLREMEGYEFVNSGTADTPGLAAAKQAIGPIAMHPMFQVYAGPKG